MQKFSVGIALCVSLTLTACVSESSYVGSDRQVGERNLDNSEAARTRISLGLNYLRRGDTTQAKYNLERAKNFAPDMPEVYNALAFYYQSVGEQVQAENAYKTALDKDSNNADAYNNYGAFLCQVGKYKEAEELLLKAISRPGYIRVAESYENLALCELDQQGYSKAKTFLESSIAHNGTRISSLINLAALNYAMGDNVGAKGALQRIQRLGRVSARSTLLNYLVADKQGDASTKQHAEQLLLTLYIDTPEARLLLQQRLLDSEFEQLREQYKLSLMANIVLPDGAAVVTEQTANPRLRVVRRKSADSSAEVGSETGSETASESAAAQTDQILSSKVATKAAEQAKTAASSVSSQAIAGSLVVSPPAADEVVNQQLRDQQAIDEQQAKQQAIADALLAKKQAEELQLAEQRAAAEALVASQQAEQDAASKLAKQQLAEQAEADALTVKLKAEKNTSSQQILAATPPVSLPPETVKVEDTAIAETSVTSDADAAEPVTADTVTADTVTSNTVDKIAADNADPEITALAESTSQASAADSEVASSSPRSHIVQEGESLYAISVLHNIRLARLMEWNKLSPGSVIKTGQQIWLAEVNEELLQQPPEVARLPDYNEPVAPAAPYHQVAKGETMFGISYKYNIRLDRFMAWNNLTEASKLRVGQQVLVIDPASIEP